MGNQNGRHNGPVIHGSRDNYAAALRRERERKERARLAAQQKAKDRKAKEDAAKKRNAQSRRDAQARTQKLNAQRNKATQEHKTAMKVGRKEVEEKVTIPLKQKFNKTEIGQGIQRANRRNRQEWHNVLSTVFEPMRSTWNAFTKQRGPAKQQGKAPGAGFKTNSGVNTKSTITNRIQPQTQNRKDVYATKDTAKEIDKYYKNAISALPTPENNFGEGPSLEVSPRSTIMGHLFRRPDLLEDYKATNKYNIYNEWAGNMEKAHRNDNYYTNPLKPLRNGDRDEYYRTEQGTYRVVYNNKGDTVASVILPNDLPILPNGAKVNVKSKNYDGISEEMNDIIKMMESQKDKGTLSSSAQQEYIARYNALKAQLYDQQDPTDITSSPISDMTNTLLYSSQNLSNNPYRKMTFSQQLSGVAVDLLSSAMIDLDRIPSAAREIIQQDGNVFKNFQRGFNYEVDNSYMTKEDNKFVGFMKDLITDPTLLITGISGGIKAVTKRSFKNAVKTGVKTAEYATKYETLLDKRFFNKTLNSYLDNVVKATNKEVGKQTFFRELDNTLKVNNIIDSQERKLVKQFFSQALKANETSNALTVYKGASKVFDTVNTLDDMYTSMALLPFAVGVGGTAGVLKLASNVKLQHNFKAIADHTDLMHSVTFAKKNYANVSKRYMQDGVIPISKYRELVKDLNTNFIVNRAVIIERYHVTTPMETPVQTLNKTITQMYNEVAKVYNINKNKDITTLINALSEACTKYTSIPNADLSTVIDELKKASVAFQFDDRVYTRNIDVAIKNLEEVNSKVEDNLIQFKTKDAAITIDQIIQSANVRQTEDVTQKLKEITLKRDSVTAKNIVLDLQEDGLRKLLSHAQEIYNTNTINPIAMTDMSRIYARLMNGILDTQLEPSTIRAINSIVEFLYEDAVNQTSLLKSVSDNLIELRTITKVPEKQANVLRSVEYMQQLLVDASNMKDTTQLKVMSQKLRSYVSKISKKKPKDIKAKLTRNDFYEQLLQHSKVNPQPENDVSKLVDTIQTSIKEDMHYDVIREKYFPDTSSPEAILTYADEFHADVAATLHLIEEDPDALGPIYSDMLDNEKRVTTRSNRTLETDENGLVHYNITSKNGKTIPITKFVKPEATVYEQLRMEGPIKQDFDVLQTIDQQLYTLSKHIKERYYNAKDLVGAAVAMENTVSNLMDVLTGDLSPFKKIIEHPDTFTEVIKDIRIALPEVPEEELTGLVNSMKLLVNDAKFLQQVQAIESLNEDTVKMVLDAVVGSHYLESDKSTEEITNSVLKRIMGNDYWQLSEGGQQASIDYFRQECTLRGAATSKYKKMYLDAGVPEEEFDKLMALGHSDPTHDIKASLLMEASMNPKMLETYAEMDKHTPVWFYDTEMWDKTPNPNFDMLTDISVIRLPEVHYTYTRVIKPNGKAIMERVIDYKKTFEAIRDAEAHSFRRDLKKVSIDMNYKDQVLDTEYINKVYGSTEAFFKFYNTGLSEEEMFHGWLKLINGGVVVAHNGNEFDHVYMRALINKYGIPEDVHIPSQYLDSLEDIKQALLGKNYINKDTFETLRKLITSHVNEVKALNGTSFLASNEPYLFTKKLKNLAKETITLDYAGELKHASALDDLARNCDEFIGNKVATRNLLRTEVFGLPAKPIKTFDELADMLYKLSLDDSILSDRTGHSIDEIIDAFINVDSKEISMLTKSELATKIELYSRILNEYKLAYTLGISIDELNKKGFKNLVNMLYPTGYTYKKILPDNAEFYFDLTAQPFQRLTVEQGMALRSIIQTIERQKEQMKLNRKIMEALNGDISEFLEAALVFVPPEKFEKYINLDNLNILDKYSLFKYIYNKYCKDVPDINYKLITETALDHDKSVKFIAGGNALTKGALDRKNSFDVLGAEVMKRIDRQYQYSNVLLDLDRADSAHEAVNNMLLRTDKRFTAQSQILDELTKTPMEIYKHLSELPELERNAAYVHIDEIGNDILLNKALDQLAIFLDAPDLEQAVLSHMIYNDGWMIWHADAFPNSPEYSQNVAYLFNKLQDSELINATVMDEHKLVFTLPKDFDFRVGEIAINDTKYSIPQRYINGQLVPAPNYNSTACTYMGTLDNDDFDYATRITNSMDIIDRLDRDDFIGSGGELLGFNESKNIYASLPPEIIEKSLPIETLYNKHVMDTHLRGNRCVYGNNKATFKGYNYATTDIVHTLENTIYTIVSRDQSEASMLEYIFNKQNSSTISNIFDGIGCTDEEIAEAIMQQPGAVLVTVVDNANKKFGKRDYGFMELTVRSAKDIALARKTNAVLIPKNVYEFMYPYLTETGFSNPVLKAWQKMMGLYKGGVLLSRGTILRNIFDSQFKAILDTKDLSVFSSDIWAMRTLPKFRRIQDNIIKANNMHTLSVGDVEKYFDRAIRKGENLDISKEDFMMIYSYFSDGAGSTEMRAMQEMMARSNIKEKATRQAKDRDGLLNPSDQTMTDALNEKLIKQDFISDSAMTRIKDLPFSAMSYTEDITRLAHFKTLNDAGITHCEALGRITDTHFNYGMKPKSTKLAELVIPFYGYTMMNLMYWMKNAFHTGPWLSTAIKTYDDAWSVDMQDESILENEQIWGQFLAGNVSLWGTHSAFNQDDNNGLDIFLKLNPSLMDAYQLVTNPMNNMFSKSLSIVQQLASHSSALEGLFANGLLSEPYGSVGNSAVSMIPFIGPLYQRFNITAESYYKKTAGMDNFWIGLANENPSTFGVKTSYNLFDQNDWSKYNQRMNAGGFIYDFIQGKYVKYDNCIAATSGEANKWAADRGLTYNFMTSQYQPEDTQFDATKYGFVKDKSGQLKYVDTWDLICQQQLRLNGKAWDFVSQSFVKVGTEGAIFDYDDYKKHMENKGFVWDFIRKVYVDPKKTNNICDTWQEATEYYKVRGMAYDIISHKWKKEQECIAKYGDWDKYNAWLSKNNIAYDMIDKCYKSKDQAITYDMLTKEYTKFGKFDITQYAEFMRKKGLEYDLINRKWVKIGTAEMTYNMLTGADGKLDLLKYTEYMHKRGLEYDIANKKWVKIGTAEMTYGQLSGKSGEFDMDKYVAYMRKKGLEYDILNKAWVKIGTAELLYDSSWDTTAAAYAKRGKEWDAIQKEWVPIGEAPTWEQYKAYKRTNGLVWDYEAHSWVPGVSPEPTPTYNKNHVQNVKHNTKHFNTLPHSQYYPKLNKIVNTRISVGPHMNIMKAHSYRPDFAFRWWMFHR